MKNKMNEMFFILIRISVKSFLSLYADAWSLVNIDICHAWHTHFYQFTSAMRGTFEIMSPILAIEITKLIGSSCYLEFLWKWRWVLNWMMFRLLPYQGCALSIKASKIYVRGRGTGYLLPKAAKKNPGSPTAYLKEPDSIRDLEN